MSKQYLTSQSLFNDALALGLKVLNDGYFPDLIVGVWRGGAPIAIALHETLNLCGHMIDNTIIRARSYTDIDQRSVVQLHGMKGLREDFPEARRLLLVDDVFDSGRTLEAIVNDLRSHPEHCNSDIRIATPYFKPARNQTRLVPDYFQFETDNWLVFPHEMCGLSVDELDQFKPDLNAKNRKDLVNWLQIREKACPM